jgi:hypothetical protein
MNLLDGTGRRLAADQKMAKSAANKATVLPFAGDRAMAKIGVTALGWVVAALPLAGCAGGWNRASELPPPNPAVVAEYPGSSLSPAGARAPAAILVVLPGAGAWAGDPALWVREGFGVVTPPPPALYRLAAEQRAELAQMLASARALADAPIWLLGPSPEIAAVLAAPGSADERVSGLVVTAAGAPAVTCSESFSYFDPGTGAKPQVRFNRSGTCPPAAGIEIGGRAIAPAPPAIRQQAPRVIEASAAPDEASPAARQAAVAQLARLIRATPSS